MKWILSLIVLALFFPAVVLAEVPTRGLPLASDRHRHKPQAKEADCCEPAAYQWVACQDANQVALYADGRQVGVYYYGSGYHALRGDTWARSCIPSGCSSPPTASPSLSDTFWQGSGTSGRNRILGNGGFRGGFFRGGRRGGCSGGG